MIRSQINEIEDKNYKELFEKLREKWSVVYPGLQLIVVLDPDEKAYRFTWGVNSEHIQEAYGSWESFSQFDTSIYMTDIFKYKIEKMEHEFEHYAIEHFLRGSVS